MQMIMRGQHKWGKSGQLCSQFSGVRPHSNDGSDEICNILPHWCCGLVEKQSHWSGPSEAGSYSSLFNVEVEPTKY